MKNSSISTFQNPPNYLSNIFSPRAMKRGNREGKKGEKMHKRRTNDRQDSSWTNFRGKSFYVRPRLDRSLPVPRFLPIRCSWRSFFLPLGTEGHALQIGPCLIRGHVAPLCEASGLEPREIPRPITCGSQLWIN